MSLFALTAALHLREQFRQTRRLRKLLLLAGVITLGLTEFLANAVPAALHVHAGSGLTAAFPLGQLLGAALLVAAARMPSGRVVLEARRPVQVTVLAAFGAFGLAELVAWLMRSSLIAKDSAQSGLHFALGHPLALVVLAATVFLFAWAAAEFARRGARDRNRVWQLFGAAALALAAARLYYLTVPRLAPGQVSPRDALRLLGFGLLFAATLRQDLEIRAGAAHAAALAERQRVARDLHDGLAQDLAFIAAHGAIISEHLGQEHPVLRATRHALAISRDTIGVLDVNSASAEETLEAIAHELGERFGIQIVVDVAPDATLGAEARTEVGRIVREALANAARHGGAKHVGVTLRRTDAGLVLRIVDDGRGLQKELGAADEGFGVRSMRDRAAGLGGMLLLHSGRTHGTEVEVILP